MSIVLGRSSVCQVRGQKITSLFLQGLFQDHGFSMDTVVLIFGAETSTACEVHCENAFLTLIRQKIIILAI